jgi:hypothetical protein
MNSQKPQLSRSRDISPYAHHRLSPCTSSTVTPATASPVYQAPDLQDPEDDPIIGQVTLNGRFTCLNKVCREDETLTFNRHADFKRHYTNMHARKLTEYFCPERGCDRSKNPTDGKKGRSFKGRRDKMKEHMATVHGKYERKRKRTKDCEDKNENENTMRKGVYSRLSTRN